MPSVLYVNTFEKEETDNGSLIIIGGGEREGGRLKNAILSSRKNLSYESNMEIYWYTYTNCIRELSEKREMYELFF